MSDRTIGALIAVACVFGIVVGAIYINEHVTCWNIFGMAKGCAVTTH